MTIIMYGIKNCDTVKKARTFLDKNGVDYRFHDYRVDGLNPIQLAAWVNELGWEALVNKRSTTWRQLPDETKEHLDQTLALAVMEDQPTLIKRPVLETSSGVTVGYKQADYEKLIG